MYYEHWLKFTSKWIEPLIHTVKINRFKLLEFIIYLEFETTNLKQLVYWNDYNTIILSI